MSALDTGLLFCKFASDTSSQFAQRGKTSAKRSYDSAVHHATSLEMTSNERAAFEEKKQALRSLLVGSVSRFDSAVRLTKRSEHLVSAFRLRVLGIFDFYPAVLRVNTFLPLADDPF